MRRLIMGVTTLALLTSALGIAQAEDNRGRSAASEQRGDSKWDQKSRHKDNGRHRGWGRERGRSYHWGRGQHIGYNDWSEARRIDYRVYHLRRPQPGYEWRRNDDRFFLVAVATGLIISVILSKGR